MGNKLGAPPGGGGGGGGGGTGTGNGTPEGAGTTAEGAGKPGDTSHSTHSRLLRPGGPAGSGAVVNGVMSEPTVAGGGSSGDPEAEGLADVPPPMMPIEASIPLSATATSVAAAVDENVSHYIQSPKGRPDQN